MLYKSRDDKMMPERIVWRFGSQGSRYLVSNKFVLVREFEVEVGGQIL